MDERALQARVGILVISALLLTAILIVLFGDFPTFFERGKTIYVTFPTAPGVTEGTPVRKSGILVGRVEKVDFAEDSSDVVVTVRLNEETELRKNEVCRINSTSLLGDAVLEFVPGDQPTQAVIGEGEHLTGFSGANPLETLVGLEDDIRGTLTSMSGAGEEVNRLAQNMNVVFGGDDRERMQRILAKTETALESFTDASNNFNTFFGEDEGMQDMQDSVRDSMKELPQAIEDTKEAMQSVKRAADEAHTMMNDFRQTMAQLDERNEEMYNNLYNGISGFDDAMGNLARFTENINEEDGTLNQLIENPELYNNLNRAVTRIEQLSTEMRPIMNDIRVFSDKIARDPSQLGVSGALRRNRDNTKYPNFKFVEPPPMNWRDDFKPPNDWHEEF